MTARSSFRDRLALAHVMIANGAPPLPTPIIDQLGAASAETRQHHDRLGLMLPLLAPDRTWRQRIDGNPSTATSAHLLAAVMGCTMVCCHLRRGGPQPAVAQLPLRRIDCARCVGTVRRPPPDEDDRCDVCGQRGITICYPFAMRQGPLLIAGDACPACAETLGIVMEAASA